MKETPVDFNPFEQKLALTETPVDGNPFGEQPPHTNIVKDGLGPQNPNALQPETPIAVPKPLMERLTAGARLSALFKGFKEGLSEGFGHETIGLKPEEEKKLQEWGLLRNPEAPNSTNPLRLLSAGVTEGAIHTTADLIDTVLRTMRAGSYGIAGGVGAYISNELGMDETQENRLKRDLVIMNDVSMAIQQPIPHKMTRTRRGTMGEVIEETVSAVPRTEKDFSDAATAIGAPDPHVQAKLQKLYEEKGVPPAEAFGDADRNPVTKQEILSNTNDLPERYGPPEPPIPPEKSLVTADAPEPPKAGSIEEAREHVLSRMSINEPDPKKPYTFDRFYKDVVDSLWFIEKGVNEAKGKDLPAVEDPYKLMRLHAGWAGKADEMINTATFGFFDHKDNGASLAKVFDLIKASGSLDDFRAFIAAARAAEMDIRGFKSGYDPAMLQVVGAARTPKMVKAFEELVNFQNRISAYARDSGLLSPKAYDDMIANNRLYVPYYEVLTEANTTSGAGNANPFKKLTGGTRKIIDPLESVVKNTYALIEAADRNYAKLQLVDMLNDLDDTAKAKGTALVLKGDDALPAKYGHNGGPDASDFLKDRADLHNAPPELVKQMNEWATGPQKDGDVVVYRNGRREVHNLDPEIANAINRADKETTHWMLSMLGGPVKLQRAGIVFAPEFGIKFLIRDSFYAAMTTVHGVLHPIDMGKAVVSMVMRDKDFHNWIKSGGADVSLVSFDRNRMQQSLQKLTEDTGLMTRTWNLVVDPNATFLQKGKGILGLPIEALNRGVVQPLQMFTDLALSTPHFAGFKKRMRQLENEQMRKARTMLERDLPAIPDDFPKGEFVIRDGVSLVEARRQLDDALKAPTAEKQRLLEAGWSSRTTSADNRRHGAMTSALNSISLFANAKIADVDVLARSIKDRPIKTSMVLLGGIGLPSAALWALQKDDPRYQQIPQHEKDMFWPVLTDKWENVNPKFQEALLKARAPSDFRVLDGRLQVNNGVIYRLPKPFTPGVIIAGTVERTLDWYFKNNPQAFKGFLGAIYDSVMGDATPTAAVPIIEQMQNRGFGGRTIIPAYLEKQLPEYQYYNNTTELSKAIGKTLSAVPGIAQYRLPSHDGTALGGIAKAATSPILIENYVRGYTGTMGDYIFRALDKGLRAVGALPDPIKPDLALADIPFVRAFVSRYPTMSSDAVQSIYNEAKDMKQHFDTFMSKAQTGDKEAMDRVMQMGGQRMWLQIDKQMEAITAQAAIVRQINQGVEKGIITPSDGRQHIDIIYFQMIQTGKSLKEQLDRIKEPSPK